MIHWLWLLPAVSFGTMFGALIMSAATLAKRADEELERGMNTDEHR